jgi:hypothetical protein
MCFVWIWEQTAIISLYSINWLVFITEMECVYCVVRSVHTVYLCVLCGSENKQLLFHYTALTDWICNRDGVCLLLGAFCPHCIDVNCVDLQTNSDYFTVQHELIGFYNRDVMCLLRGTLCPHSVFMCFLWIISLYNINWLVFITNMECVYCAVRSAHTMYLCVLCGSENKQRLFHCAALTDWFL